MALTDKRVTDALLQTGVAGAPDKLTGTAAENKAVFDRLIRNIVAGCLNPVIDELAGEGGAAAVGTAVAGLEGETVAAALAGLKALCEDRYTKTEAEERLTRAVALLVKGVELREDGVWIFTTQGGERIIVDNAMGPFMDAVRQAREAAQKAGQAADRATEVAGGDFATHTEIKGKADKPLLPVAGNLVEMDGEGNLRDAGRTAGELALQSELEKRAVAAQCVTAALRADGWQGQRRPYIQEIQAETGGRKGFALMSPEAAKDQWDVCRRAGLRLDGETETGLRFAADGEKPALDLPIVLFLVG